MPHYLLLALPLLLAACVHGPGKAIVPGQQTADCLSYHLEQPLTPAPTVRLTHSEFRTRFGAGDASSATGGADAVCHDGTVYYFGRMDAQLAAHEQAHCAKRSDGQTLGFSEDQARAAERLCKSPALPGVKGLAL